MPRLPHHRFALRSLAPSAIRLAPAVGLALAVLAAAPAAAQAPADPTAETTPTPADVRGNGLQFVGVRSGESPAPAARLGVRGEGFEGLAIVLENADGEPVATAAGTSAAVLMTGPAEARVPWTAADAAPGAYRLRVRGLGPGRTLVEDEIGFEVGPAEPIPFRAGFPVATPPQLEAGVAEPLGLEVDGQPEAGEDLLVVAWDPERLEMREGFTHVLKAPPFEIDGEKLATLDPGAVELQVMQRRDGEVLGIAKRPIEVVTELQEAAAAGVLPGAPDRQGADPRPESLLAVPDADAAPMALSLAADPAATGSASDDNGGSAAGTPSEAGADATGSDPSGSADRSAAEVAPAASAPGSPVARTASRAVRSDAIRVPAPATPADAAAAPPSAPPAVQATPRGLAAPGVSVTEPDAASASEPVTAPTPVAAATPRPSPPSTGAARPIPAGPTPPATTARPTPPRPSSPPTRGENGFTSFPVAADARVLHVSSSDGDDRNNGLTPERPFATVERAKEFLRDGHPDRLLLKAGDVFEGPFGFWGWSGRSAEEPMVVSTYGEGDRPLFRCGDETGLLSHTGRGVSHVMFQGFELLPERRVPGTPDFDPEEANRYGYGILWRQSGGDVLFEDLKVTYFAVNVNITANSPGDNPEGEARLEAERQNRHVLDGVTVRRCIISNSYAVTGHSQGLFSGGTRNFSILESVFDHNGWNDAVEGAHRTIFNHNIYVYYTLNAPVRLEGNIITRGASHGAQLRPGGIGSRNFFAQRLGVALSRWTQRSHWERGPRE